MTNDIKELVNNEQSKPKNIIVSCRLSRQEYIDFQAAYSKVDAKNDNVGLRVAIKRLIKEVNKNVQKTT